MISQVRHDQIWLPLPLHISDCSQWYFDDISSVGSRSYNFLNNLKTPQSFSFLFSYNTKYSCICDAILYWMNQIHQKCHTSFHVCSQEDNHKDAPTLLSKILLGWVNRGYHWWSMSFFVMKLGWYLWNDILLVKIRSSWTSQQHETR